RRTRNRDGEAGISAKNVRRRGCRLVRAAATGARSEGTGEPRENVSVRRGSGLGLARVASVGKGRSDQPGMTVCAPKSIVEVIEAVRASPRIVVRGSGSKTALSAAPDGATVLE